jgi:hypothetical protein
MTRFDRTDTSLIESKIRQSTKNPEIGIVDQVFEHKAEDDDSNFEVDLLTEAKTNKIRRVPVLTPGSSAISVPKKGDKMTIFYTEGENFRPIAMGNAYSNTDRPPVGRAGMYKNFFESGDSPAGEGGLNITGYTSFSEDPASIKATDGKVALLDPDEAVVQIAKHRSDRFGDPTQEGDVPMKLEVYDSELEDESHIAIGVNKVDGSDSDSTWGIKFDVKTGGWQLVGPTGFGIESDGEGNFTWHHKTIEFNEVSGDTGPLDIDL